jgi:hypothetical protein
VQGDGMTDRNVVCDGYAVLLLHAMKNAAILDIAMRADADGVHIATENCVHPDAGMLAENDISDQLRGIVHVAGGGNSWCNALVGTNHDWKNLNITRTRLLA